MKRGRLKEASPPLSLTLSAGLLFLGYPALLLPRLLVHPVELRLELFHPRLELLPPAPRPRALLRLQGLFRLGPGPESLERPRPELAGLGQLLAVLRLARRQGPEDEVEARPPVLEVPLDEQVHRVSWVDDAVRGDFEPLLEADEEAVHLPPLGHVRPVELHRLAVLEQEAVRDEPVKARVPKVLVALQKLELVDGPLRLTGHCGHARHRQLLPRPLLVGARPLCPPADLLAHVRDLLAQGHGLGLQLVARPALLLGLHHHGGQLPLHDPAEHLGRAVVLEEAEVHHPPPRPQLVHLGAEFALGTVAVHHGGPPLAGQPPPARGARLRGAVFLAGGRVEALLQVFAPPPEQLAALGCRGEVAPLFFRQSPFLELGPVERRHRLHGAAGPRLGAAQGLLEAVELGFHLRELVSQRLHLLLEPPAPLPRLPLRRQPGRVR
mmetsp:Transcript_46868/g.106098  ORF Transcript_46868/g.106098 Transcript_46868/m.106098 type:complete len:438 (+) Transcript_46868:353-1666(+)